MAFLHRLKYYLIGVGLGILMVMAIFKDRNLSEWMPEDQVLLRATSENLQFSPEAICQLECIHISQDSLKSLISKGDVSFKKSEVHGKSKIYHIDLEFDKIDYLLLEIENEDVSIKELFVSDACEC